MPQTALELNRQKDNAQDPALFRHLMNQSNDSIFLIDAKTGQFVDVNNSSCIALGYSFEELVNGMSVKDIEAVIPDNFSWEAHVQEVKRRGNVVIIGKHRRKDGSVFPVEVSISFGKTPDRDYIVAFVRNIEERTKQEELIALQQKTIVQNAKMAALGLMAGGVAHEINNPLAIIQSFAGEIKEQLKCNEINKERLVHMSTKIETTAGRIAKIITGLREFSKDGADDPMNSLPLLQMVEDTLVFCREKFKVNGINLVLDQFPQDAIVNGVEMQLSQVLLNLLNNAFDAVMKLEKKWIKIGCRSDENSVEITVTDSGLGIPVESRGKIFVPFYTTKDFGKGMGLNLSISKGIIEKHGGKIYVDYLCKNTCFVISMPLLVTQKNKKIVAG